MFKAKISQKMLSLLFFAAFCFFTVNCDNGQANSINEISVSNSQKIIKGQPKQIVVSSAMGRFDLSEEDGFYSMPFPMDLRITDKGTIRVTDFPNPISSPIIRKYLEVGERDVTGFGANSGVFLSFVAPIDVNTLPRTIEDSVRDSSSAYIVSIDPSSSDYGRKYPIKWRFTEEATDYGPTNLLVLLPYQGVPMLHGKTYAAIITNKVLGADGLPLRRNRQLVEVLNNESENLEANNVFEPLVAYLDDKGISKEKVTLATVYTTIDPIPRMAALRDHVYIYNLPGIDGAGIVLDQERDDLYVLTGQVTIPIYQEGSAPYLINGGAIEFDQQGVPIVQYDLVTRLVITLPKGEMPDDGWPLLIYSHGSGGSWKSFLSKGVARWLALKGMAVVSIDAPHHGPRNPISTDNAFESFCFYNALNPESFRDNNVQAAVELMAVLRQMTALTISSDVLPSVKEKESYLINFDENYLFFMGHSQGSTVGPLITALDPNIKGAYFSGAGASLLWNMLTKEEPFSIFNLVRLLIGMTPLEGQEYLDEFHPILNIIQHMAELVDPVGFNPYLFDRPVAGVLPKDIMQAQGVTDTYVGFPCHGAFAASAGMDMIEPIVGQDAWDRMEWTGASLLDDIGVWGNRTDYDGYPVTSAAVQYDQWPEGGDGHYVTFQYPSMHRRVACFFRTYIDNGIATIVDDAGDENDSCEIIGKYEKQQD